jgi:hypothetical protein
LEGHRESWRIGGPEDIAEADCIACKIGFRIGETIVVDGGALQAQ